MENMVGKQNLYTETHGAIATNIYLVMCEGPVKQPFFGLRNEHILLNGRLYFYKKPLWNELIQRK